MNQKHPKHEQPNHAKQPKKTGTNPSEEGRARPNLWQILISVLGALFGVQSSAVRERDFTRGQPWWVYVIVGFVVVVLIVLLLMGLTKLILVLAR